MIPASGNNSNNYKFSQSPCQLSFRKILARGAWTQSHKGEDLCCQHAHIFKDADVVVLFSQK